MRKALEEKLAQLWPGWFSLSGDPMSSEMARGFEHGDGWFGIVWRVCSDLEPLVVELEKETGERFEILQVKEKLGTLRFYVGHHTDAIDRRIEEAQMESARPCEVCGQPSRQQEVRGWVLAKCHNHADSLEEGR
jgi:hypothetical protein